MYSNPTPSMLPESRNSYKPLNPFTFNIKQVCDTLNFNAAVFLAWTSLFWFEIPHKNTFDVF